MTLTFLDFDYSDDDDGHGSFDAMAAVSPAQWPLVQAEVQRVLAWAHREFPGARGDLDEGGQWDWELQGVRETPTTLHLYYDDAASQLRVDDGEPGQPRITVSLTLTGTPAFCAALREAFAIG